MPTAYDVPPDLLIKRLSEHLRRVPQIAPPSWASYAKTGAHTEHPPQDTDWWFTRVASLLRKIYIHGPVGLSDLEPMYGGRTTVGSSLAHHRRGGGSSVRVGLHQLEAAGFVAKQTSRGRVVTAKGKSLADRLSTEILKELVKSSPQLARYA